MHASGTSSTTGVPNTVGVRVLCSINEKDEVVDWACICGVMWCICFWVGRVVNWNGEVWCICLGGWDGAFDYNRMSIMIVIAC